MSSRHGPAVAVSAPSANVVNKFGWLTLSARRLRPPATAEYLRLRLRLRLIYLGRIAEKVKYITYLGCAPARREGSRTENWKIYEE